MPGKKKSRVSVPRKRGSKRQSPKNKKRSSKKRPMNAFFKAMLAAKKSKANSFQYNGNTYKAMTTKTGMTVYKKA